jgi:CRP/FNR family transcriptional regulator, cyclic AMP receptor protein
MAVEWPLLRSLDDEERASLLAIARRRIFARGEVVFHRDDPADTIHLIRRGRFAARIVTPLGDTATLAILVPGDTFGELALVAGGRRTATIVALEAAETRSIHQTDFSALRRQHPHVTEVVVGALAAHVDRLSAQLVDALYVPADRRVLRRVAETATLYEDGDGGGDERGVEVPLTQEDLAGLAGTSRATVNRVLREAERRGEVRLARGRVVVLDRAALARRSGPA